MLHEILKKPSSLSNSEWETLCDLETRPAMGIDNFNRMKQLREKAYGKQNPIQLPSAINFSQQGVG